MKKIVFNIFIGVYLITTILITYVLLSYNKYNIAEFNNSYLFADKSNLMIVNKDDNIKMVMIFIIMVIMGKLRWVR